jgi:hypothetical protein
MTGLRLQLNMGRAEGYVDAMRYSGNGGFLAGRPFMPLFMATDQVWNEVPAFGVYPQVD